MKILALDLSLSSTGYCIIDENYNLIAYETIQTKAKNFTEEERLYIIGKEINRLMKEYDITHVCIENSYKSVNIKTTQQLAKLLGISTYLGIDNGLEVHTVSPTVARKHILNKGNATKEEVANYIRENHWDMGEYSDKETKAIKKTSDIYDSALLGLFLLKKLELDKKYRTNK